MLCSSFRCVESQPDPVKAAGLDQPAVELVGAHQSHIKVPPITLRDDELDNALPAWL